MAGRGTVLGPGGEQDGVREGVGVREFVRVDPHHLEELVVLARPGGQGRSARAGTSAACGRKEAGEGQGQGQGGEGEHQGFHLVEDGGELARVPRRGLVEVCTAGAARPPHPPPGAEQ
jgi:hypothetical protein